MIQNLLDLSKADEGKLIPRPSAVDLPPLIDEVLSELGVHAASCGVSLRASLDADRVYADQELLRRTLTNLVENSIRHAPPGTSVTVGAAQVSGGTELRVIDAGKGVAHELREKVFSPFVQVETGERAFAKSNQGLGS